MSRFIKAAIAAILFTLPQAALADASSSHGYRSAQARGGLLVLTTTEIAPVASPVRSRAQLGTRRLVRLDGEMVWMDEVDLRAQISAGAYSIVATSTDAGPLPAWF